MTGGKYSRFDLEEGFLARCAEGEAYPLLSASQLSTGTADQLYLALRLALCELVLGEQKPPLILDDSLIMFDDERCEAALRLLKEIAQSRQVILFSCRKLR